MSQVSAAASNAVPIDWGTVALASATFIATLITTVWGWLQGRKKFNEHLKPKEGQDVPLAAGVIMDNQSIRESTMVQREVRDQLLILNHSLMQYNRNQEEIAGLIEDLVKELKHRNG